MKIKKKEYYKISRNWIKGHFICGIFYGFGAGALGGFLIGKNNILAIALAIGLYFFMDDIESWEFRKSKRNITKLTSSTSSEVKS